MNEFEWRQQMRALRTSPLPPERLWRRVDAQLDAPRARARRSPRQAWLAAAGFAGLSLFAMGLANRQLSVGGSAAVATLQRPWKPSDPRLAGAAIELDAARVELEQALRQSPDSTALRHLLVRTQNQQTRLRQLERAG